MVVNSSASLELSQRVSSLEPSATLAISAKAKAMKQQGIDVIALSAGEPDFDTPEFIKKAAADALAGGATKYTPATGSVELRQAIAKKISRDQGLEFPFDQIIVSNGAKHSVFNVLFALLNKGDEVLIPAPYWLSYPDMVTLVGEKSVILQTEESTDFKVTPEILAKAITPQSKVLILNSPSNPTGAVYTEGELQALIAVLKQHPRIWVISDEIYEKLLFDGRKHVSIAALDEEIAQRTVIVNGHSKAYAMTGWRLGYAACPSKALAKGISSLQSHSTSGPNTFAQAGGVQALEQGDKDAAAMRETYERRRDMFVELLAAIPQLKPFKPQGAFYAFVNIKGSGLSSVELAENLLDEAHVAVVPGKPFGSDDHVRMSFATSDEKLKEAARRMAEWFSKKS